ncbi:MAG: LPP20 family lipoprotein [Syntrophales bacterium LBB04]|nr:LPP20 family lipoprotein [Syntrophales bacterium LBB04]
MKNRIFIFVLLYLFIGLPLATLAHAGEEGKGGIDWVGGYITAIGNGTSEKPSLAQARLLARRAAVVDAQRNLLEMINGVKVDSQTTVENFTVKQDIIKTNVSGIVKGAHIVKDSFEKQPDGSIVATVEMRICMNQCKESANSLVQALGLDKKKEDITTPPQLPPQPMPPAEVPPQPKETKGYAYDTTKPVTGIVFNLEGRMFERVIMPVIVTTGANKTSFTVYSAKSVNPNVVRTYGVVRYANTVDQALKNTHLGDNVMIISAEDITSEKMILIKLESAKAIQETTLHGNDYLANAKVMISSN